MFTEIRQTKTNTGCLLFQIWKDPWRLLSSKARVCTIVPLTKLEGESYYQSKEL